MTTTERYEQLESLGLVGCQIIHVFKIFEVSQNEMMTVLKLNEERIAEWEEKIERRYIAQGGTLPFTPKWQMQEQATTEKP